MAVFKDDGNKLVSTTIYEQQNQHLRNDRMRGNAAWGHARAYIEDSLFGGIFAWMDALLLLPRQHLIRELRSRAALLSVYLWALLLPYHRCGRCTMASDVLIVISNGYIWIRSRSQAPHLIQRSATIRMKRFTPPLASANRLAGRRGYGTLIKGRFDEAG